ncbi:Radical SAM superfamily Radical SAM C terminal domain [Trypanosoma vivax]|uniref:tRNA carboxymethyluridine synthase n=1 Tax=Trypanosoma vivax (strain Y486) TaxID=1055687 RepID=G0U1G5_TRYVY|nr:putative histone acetyltransferase-like protein [Trypanosoma vivax]KAH8608967.1 Radical SAM superfamily Radical SAM C terminal domain [Trypanosoma vivax]CCC49921.1 putative histone acetyltransferase-like protein [Trypanosoma vivax Y486]
MNVDYPPRHDGGLGSEEAQWRTCADEPNIERMNEKLRNLPTLERLLNEKDPNSYTEEEEATATKYIEAIVDARPASAQEIEQLLRKLMKKHSAVVKKSLLLAVYRKWLAADPQRTGDAVLERYFTSKAPRSQSGVLVVTVFTSPYPEGQKFSCKWNCYYCPNEPGQPRSYLLNEPGVRRANRLQFDPYKQFQDRVKSLVAIGHPADKVELLVLGGTWESYPLSYREAFIRDLFYAANTFFDCYGNGSVEIRGDQDSATREGLRPPMDLLQEQLLNETAGCKIIGVTLETRPDTINVEMLQQLRRFGCTRVQLGIQHTDDAVLTAVNRQSTREDAIRAIKLLKDSCFKVDIHLMPDLPGSTPENDKAMFSDVLYSPHLQADQWKIYPCQTTPFTVIEKWYKEGKYKPYGLSNLIDVILYAKVRVQPWVRLNRVVRDIPHDYILGGVEVSNLRQLLAMRLAKEGNRCRCIRCREVKGDAESAAKLDEASLVEHRYSASEGEEVFLSYESRDGSTLFGFLRLRLNIENWVTPFEELTSCALIRELHVYGNLVPAHMGADATKAQHRGVGTMLLQRAERIALEGGYHKIAVISGVGVRNYYRRRGYTMVARPTSGAYLIKDLDSMEKVVPPAACVVRSVTRSATDIDLANQSAMLGESVERHSEEPEVPAGLWGRLASIWRRWKRPRQSDGQP